MRDPGLGRSPGRSGHHQSSSLTRCETIALWTALRSAKLAEFGAAPSRNAGATGAGRRPRGRRRCGLRRCRRPASRRPYLARSLARHCSAPVGRDLGESLGQRDHRLRGKARRRVSRGSRAARSTATSKNAGGTSPSAGETDRALIRAPDGALGVAQGTGVRHAPQRAPTSRRSNCGICAQCRYQASLLFHAACATTVVPAGLYLTGSRATGHNGAGTVIAGVWLGAIGDGGDRSGWARRSGGSAR